MRPPTSPPPNAARVHRLRTSFEVAARGQYTMPIVLALGVVGMVVNEGAYQHSEATLNGGIALTDARVKSAETLQRLTEVGLYARSYILTANPEEAQRYRAAVEDLQSVKASAFDLVAQIDPQKSISVAPIERLIDEHIRSTDAWIDMVARGERAPAIAAAASGASLARRNALRQAFADVLTQAAAIQQVARGNLYNALMLNRVAVHLLALATMLGLFLFQRQLRRGDRQMVEEGQRLAERVKERTAELTEMATHLVNAREDERAHVARELHDELGGLLTSMKLDFARLRRQTDLPDKTVERIRAIEDRLGEGIAFKRRIVEDLHPSALAQLGLVQALEILCREMAERLGKPVHAELQDVVIDKPAQLTLYRITQESLTNIGKYAGCSEVRVRLQADGDTVRLSIRDDGKGFDPQRVPHGRHGLLGMRVRVESHGGRLQVSSAPGAGTTIAASLPSAAVQD
jgi:signal transduction histidine kinase